MTERPGSNPDRSGLFTVGEAFCYGAIVPAGSLYVITAGPTPGVVTALGDVLLLAWLALIALGTTMLGSWRRIPTDSLLGGGLLGTVAGWLGFAALVGSDLVVIALAFLGGVAIALGSWGAYELRRRRGSAREPPWGSWRVAFVIGVALLLLPVVLLLVL